MLKNYLLTVLRNWLAHRLLTFINIGGLTVGLTCAVFIMLFMRDELSYDRWIPDSENLYRVSTDINSPGQPLARRSSVAYPILPAMADNIPEVTAMTRLARDVDTVSVGDRRFAENIDLVDPQFFQVIKLPLLEGDPSSVFSNPESVVISQSIAKKYFGDEAGGLGRNLTVTEAVCPKVMTVCEMQAHTLLVTGILRDLPHNTQMVADLILPLTSSANRFRNNPALESWLNGSTFGYVRLAAGADPEKVLEKFKDLIDRSVKFDMLPNDKSRPSEYLVPHLTRFWDAHLTIDQYHGLTPPGSLTTVYGFGAIGVLILLLACFNFTNLAIAGATLRAREISLRKVMGARRNQIVVQFLGEAVLMALIAFLLALALLQPLLPSFDRLLNKPITLHYLHDWLILVIIAAASIAAGLVSGLYPAVVLSKFKPAIALRCSTAQVASGSGFRSVLVILQFAASIGLGIATAVVFTQISYMRHIDLGFRMNNMVVVRNLEDMSAANRESFINELKKYPGIVQATLTGRYDIPIANEGALSTGPFRLSADSPWQTLREVAVDPEFFSTYEVRLLAGRLLSDGHGGDVVSQGPGSSHNVLINAFAARQFGFTPEEMVGKSITGAGGGIWTIVGVIDDVKMDGPRRGAEGIFYAYEPIALATASIRMRSGQVADTLAFIDKTWSAFAPGLPINRSLIEDVYNGMFDSDERQGQVLSLFVGIAIFIACLGLFGLAAFAAERRTKEIGLRKTFGAKTHHVVVLLLWQFSIPVLAANAVAWPVAYYYLHGWLNGYADRISLNPLYFVSAGAAALAIAWATVYVHAYRMARANPIKALRYE